MGAKEELLEKAKKLREEVDSKKAAEDKTHAEIVKRSIDAVKANAKLADMYRKNASIGSENLGSSLPMIKIHSTGRSTKNFLVNGQEPNDGWFFYQPTQEQFETLECHILTISRGYRALDMNGVPKFNQIMGGVFKHDGKMIPFIMYLTGIKLKAMWEFGKEAGQYTRSKSMPIPMFAMTVKLTTEKIKTEFAPSWIVKFEIKRDEDMNPILVTDPILFTQLRDAVEKVEDKIAPIIESKSVADAVKEEIADANPEQGPATIHVDEKTGEAVNPEDIPF